MQHEYLQELLQVLEGERVPFQYFRDRYALWLMADQLGDEAHTLRDLKKSALGRFLQKPIVRQYVQDCLRQNRVSAQELNNYWPADLEFYNLTFGEWGADAEWERDWEQTCRRGYNLVVQVNFGSRHEAYFDVLHRVFGYTARNMSGHPTSARYRTMGWARIDFDEGTDEALIEEVQSDWFQDTSGIIDRALHRARQREKPFRRDGDRFVSRVSALSRYREEFDRHRRIWQEVILTAALQVIRDELKLSSVYFHTVESNLHLKDMEGWEAPRSVYTDLPRRFGFQRVSTPPRFLERDADGFARYKLRRCTPEWYRYDFGGRNTEQDRE